MKKYIIVIVVAFLAVTVMGLGNWFSTSSPSNCLSGPNGPTPKIPDNASLFQAIKTVTVGNNRFTAAMLLGSHVESDWYNNAIGAGSYGPYQIQDPGVINLGITVAEAMNPAKATAYMAPRYKAAINYVDPTIWSTNPEQAAEEVAVGAEKPAVPYYDGRTPDVHIGWQATLTVMQQLGLSTDFNGRSLQKLAPMPVSKPSPGATRTAGPIVPPVVPITCQTISNNYGSYIKAAPAGAARTVVAAALKEVGLPYVYGGGTAKGPSGIGADGRGPGFDCSGLALYAFAKVGIDLPHQASIQWQLTRKFQVSLAKAKPGDLIFFVTDGSYAAPGHVGIYLGNNMMVAAPQTGENVKVQSIDINSPIVGLTHPYK